VTGVQTCALPILQDALDADAGHGRARDGRPQRAPQRVADGVAETGLEGLEHEPRAVLGDDLLGEGGPLGDEHVLPLSILGARYLTPWEPTVAGRAAVCGPPGDEGGQITSSRARRSAAPAAAHRSARARGAGGRGSAGSSGRPAATPGRDARRGSPGRSRTSPSWSTWGGRRRCRTARRGSSGWSPSGR